MTRRLAAITAWLLAGHAMLLQVPESSTLMLAASSLLAVLTVFTAAAVQSGAMGAWTMDAPVARGLRAGARRASAALVAAVVFGALWWLTGHALEWHARLSGQMDAAMMARTGSPNTAWLHAGLRWLILFVRWSLGLSLAVSALGALVAEGRAALRRFDWLRQAAAPRRLLVITAWFVVLDLLPWLQVGWRPAHLSLAVEPWFVGAKLSVIAVVMATGWALILREGSRR
jgi:hypothetical protein